MPRPRTSQLFEGITATTIPPPMDDLSDVPPPPAPSYGFPSPLPPVGSTPPVFQSTHTSLSLPHYRAAIPHPPASPSQPPIAPPPSSVSATSTDLSTPSVTAFSVPLAQAAAAQPFMPPPGFPVAGQPFMPPPGYPFMPPPGHPIPGQPFMPPPGVAMPGQPFMPPPGVAIPGQPFMPPPGSPIPSPEGAVPFTPGEAPRPPDYASASYWDQRYGAKPEPFEWYQTWAEVYTVVKDYCAGADRALNVGCGNSPMSVEMGSIFPHVMNIDISSVIIDEMAQKFAQFTNVEWKVMDCTKMTFDDNLFDVVFDKGTVDALLCDDTSIPVIVQVLKEVYRVMKPGGYFVEITYGTPQLRSSLWEQLGLDWRLLDPVTIENPRRKAWHWIYCFQKPPFHDAPPAPAVRFPEPEYANVDYWDYRYSLKPEPFEWYQTWPEVYEVIKHLCRGAKRALNIGCGNSPMSVEMGKIFQFVVNIDISRVVIKDMSEKFKPKTKIQWHVMDWVKMSFKDSSFDIVFDKGTQDALLCSQQADEIIAQSMKEAHRVLKRAGYFFEITYAPPQQRMEMFRSLGLNWRILNPVTLENPRRKAWHWIYCFQKL